jgi:predicted phosphoribosyltransferase
MSLPFMNREEAGRLLAERLRRWERTPSLVILGLPRGGIPVAAIVARILQAPLDVLTVRKLGVPAHEEFAMGAIATGGIQVLHRDVIQRLAIPAAAVEAVRRREARELARREAAYRDHRPFPVLSGATVILVDDGIATGASMQAAVEAVRQQHPARIIVAAPVISAPAADLLGKSADQSVAVAIPEPFMSVGAWYRDFHPVSDAEVRRHLMRAGGKLPEEVGHGSS